MRISDFLQLSDVLIDMQASDKASLLHDLGSRAAKTLGMDPAIVVAALDNREQIGSTGVGDGVAIPHARFQNLEKPFGLFVRLKKAIDFDAIDEKRVDLVFLLLLPADQKSQQLNALASVARTLRNQEIQTRLRQASDVAALHHIVTSG
jgi:PTS system nitrogen regulatory IIA component